MEKLGDGLFACSLCAEPRTGSCGSACEPIWKLVFLFNTVLWDLRMLILTGYQSQVISGLLPQVAALNAGTLDQTLCSWGRSWESWIPSWLYVAMLGLGFMAREHLSLFYLFQCGYFLICQMYRSCPGSSWISFRGNCFTCSCRLGVFVVGGEFGSPLCCHLV